MACVVFVYPDFEAVGVEVLLAVCRQAGHRAELVFYRAADTYLGETARVVPCDAIAAQALAMRPDVVAFSCVTDNYQQQLRCARAVKAASPDTLTLFGGIHVTSVPERVLRQDGVDGIGIGEGEISLVAFLDALDANQGIADVLPPVTGIVFKRRGELVGDLVEGPLADLDVLPHPEKQSFRRVLSDARSEYRLITSRGCPFHCAYCYNSFVHSSHCTTRVRRRSVDRVLDELVRARRASSINYVLFLDDAFTQGKKWIRAFAPRYAREVGLPFACVGHPSHFDEETCALLADAGCVNTQLGVQSTSRSLHEEMLDRRYDLDSVERAIRLLKASGIMVQVDHMLGVPGDTMANQEHAARFYNRVRPDLISVLWLTYYPRTAIVDKALARGAIHAADIEAIEEGFSLTGTSYLNGGSMRDTGAFHAISLLLNWLPLLPRPVVDRLITSGLYRRLLVRSFYLNTALPRAVQSLINPRDFRGRSHLRRFVGKALDSFQGASTALSRRRHRSIDDSPR